MNTLLKWSAAGALLLAASQSNAIVISTSASGTMFGDNYSYLFEISGTEGGTTFSAKLTNTSPMSGPEIDLLAFNTNPDFSCCGMGDDLYITSISPDWTFELSGMGVSFDYVGDADPAMMNSNRLAMGEMLTFDMIFSSGQSFDIFTMAESNLGTGIGGGEDSGQACVSFQSLGDGGEGSDLLCSNWERTPVPEASSLALLGLGLLGIGVASRRKAS